MDSVDTIIPIKYFSDFHHSGKALRMILIYLAEDSGQEGHFSNYEKYQTFSFYCLWLSTRSALREEIWSWQKAQAGRNFENTSLNVLSRLFPLQLMDPQKRREASRGACLSLQTLGGWNGRIFSSRSAYAVEQDPTFSPPPVSKKKKKSWDETLGQKFTSFYSSIFSAWTTTGHRALSSRCSKHPSSVVTAWGDPLRRVCFSLSCRGRGWEEWTKGCSFCFFPETLSIPIDYLHN